MSEHRPKRTFLRFSQFSRAAARLAGQPVSFLLAIAVVLVWMLTGPLFHYSDTWQLVINTSTTVITFLMVFLIQNTQNRDMLALQVKLDELIRAVEAARNTVLNLEELDDAELEVLIQKYERLGRHAQRRGVRHTVAEAIAAEGLNPASSALGQLPPPAGESTIR